MYVFVHTAISVASHQYHMYNIIGSQIFLAKTGTPQLKDLMNEVTPHYCDYWTEIGTQLDMPQGILDSIEIEHSYGKWVQQRCCNKMFKEWLERDTSASWEKLDAAIKSPAVAAFSDKHISAGL